MASGQLAGDVVPVMVHADSDRIVQALVNLLGNAVKFSPRGGTVSLTVTRENDQALFSVADTGRGIPADRLESIFERFRQVDASDARETGGTGLGLPIARGIVEQHGGRMWAESQAGGSTFRFTLALAADNREASQPVEGEAAKPRAARLLSKTGASVQARPRRSTPRIAAGSDVV